MTTINSVNSIGLTGLRGKTGPPGSTGQRGPAGSAYLNLSTNQLVKKGDLIEIAPIDNMTGFVEKINDDQVGQWDWVANISSDQNYSFSTQVDSLGNAYVIGYYTGSAVFYNSDGTIGLTLVYTNTGTDAYIAKIDPYGKWVWATRIVGNADDYGIDIDLDADGNCLTSGYYGSTILTLYNADNTVGSILTSTSSTNGFVGKISADGQWIWTASVSGVDPGDLQFISTDMMGNCYVAGTYSSDIVFRNADGTSNYTLTDPIGTEAYVGKISSDGFWSWALHITNFNADMPFRMNFNAEGDGYVIIVANTNTPIFFNADDSYFYSMNNDGFLNAYIGKLSRNGYWIWTTSIGSTSLSALQSIKMGHLNNGYMIGLFDSTNPIFFFDIVGNVDIILSTTGDGIYLFVAKIKPNGTWSWVAYMGPQPTSGNVDLFNQSIDVDVKGNSYVIGSYYQPIVFYNKDTTIGSQLDLTSGGPYAYVAKLDNLGYWQYSNKISSEVFGMDISLDSIYNIYVTGSYSSNPITFYNSDNSISTKLPLSGNENTFVGKLIKNNDTHTVGIAQQSAFGSNNPVMTFPGGVVMSDMFTGLIPGYYYYVDSRGILSANNDSPIRFVGLALTPTIMLTGIKKPI